jgi:hypothetical protein
MQVLLRINWQCGSKGGEFLPCTFLDVLSYMLLTHMSGMKLNFHKRVIAVAPRNTSVGWMGMRLG